MQPVFGGFGKILKGVGGWVRGGGVREEREKTVVELTWVGFLYS